MYDKFEDIFIVSNIGEPNGKESITASSLSLAHNKSWLSCVIIPICSCSWFICSLFNFIFVCVLYKITENIIAEIAANITILLLCFIIFNNLLVNIILDQIKISFL